MAESISEPRGKSGGQNEKGRKQPLGKYLILLDEKLCIIDRQKVR